MLHYFCYSLIADVDGSFWKAARFHFRVFIQVDLSQNLADVQLFFYGANQFVICPASR